MTTYTSQPDETTGVDAYIRDGTSADINYGASSAIFVGESNAAAAIYRGLIKFDLSSLAGATILSAGIYITPYVDYSDNTRALRVFRLLRAWTESGVTWNKYDGVNAWGTSGGFNATDCEQTDIGSVSILATQTLDTPILISLDAAKVQEWVDGVLANNGLLLKMDTETNDMFGYASSSYATANLRPQLVIGYTIGTYSCIWTSE